MYLPLIVSVCFTLIVGNLVVNCSYESQGEENGQEFKEGRQKWKEIVDESTQSNRELSRFQPPVTNIPNEESLRIRARARGSQTTGELPFLTGTLLAWITTQTENIVEELEAIAKDNAQSNVLSIKNYVRYLSINNELGVIARQPIDELRWVRNKYKIFAGVFESAQSVVSMWLHNRETELYREEANELSRDQHHIRLNGPTKKWIKLYEDINFVATQVSYQKSVVIGWPP